MRADKTPKNAINGLPTHGAAAEEETSVAASSKSEQPRLSRGKYRKAILNANPRGSVLIECDDFFSFRQNGTPAVLSFSESNLPSLFECLCEFARKTILAVTTEQKKQHLAGGDHFFPSDYVAQRCLNAGRTAGRQQRQHHWPPDHGHRRPIPWGDDRRHCASQPILRGTELLCTGFRWFPAPLGTTPTTFRAHGTDSTLNNCMICAFYQPNRSSW